MNIGSDEDTIIARYEFRIFDHDLTVVAGRIRR